VVSFLLEYGIRNVQEECPLDILTPEDENTTLSQNDKKQYAYDTASYPRMGNSVTQLPKIKSHTASLFVVLW
jgi:uncharacterized protein (DUF362 family)